MHVRGRQILDLMLIAIESMNSRIRSGEPGILCKLHMVNAYNCVLGIFALLIMEVWIQGTMVFLDYAFVSALLCSPFW